jgi:hypothetical protein
MVRNLTDLKPTEFENLTFDLLQRLGVDNLVWRTPGADGGRDLQCTVREADIAGGITNQQWYVECKRYSASISWPIVWQKLAYAQAHDADYFLLVTNSNPSPRCETEIAQWNRGKSRPKVRFWRGYELHQILLGYPEIAGKYGLRPQDTLVGLELIQPTFLLMKIVQSTYVGSTFGADIEAGIEASAALAELMSQRTADLRQYGRYVVGSKATAAPDYKWLLWSGPCSDWEECSLRALLTVTRYVSGAPEIAVEATTKEIRVKCVAPRVGFSDQALSAMRDVALLAQLQIVATSTDEWSYTAVPAEGLP